MENYVKSSLSDFARRAMQRLQDKKVVKYARLFVPSLNQEIKIRNLSFSEITECTEVDEIKADAYAVYLATVEPNLKDTAAELKELGEIKEYLDVVEVFDMTEVSEIAMEIMKLSGVLNNKKVTVVDELKNS